MDPILLMAVWKAFSWMEIIVFQFKFTEVCSLGPILQEVNIGLDNGLGPSRRQAIWSNDSLVIDMLFAKCCPICLGFNKLNDLKPSPLISHYSETIPAIIKPLV